MDNLAQRPESELERYFRPEQSMFGTRPEVSLVDYLRIFSRRKWSILAIWLTIVMVALIYNMVATKYYQSRSSIIIRVGSPVTVLKTREITFPNYFAQRSQFQTKTKLITTIPILTKAAEILVNKGYFRPPNFEQMSEEEKEKLYRRIAKFLRGRVSSKVVEKTSLIHIFAVDTDPKRASAIANAVAEAMVNYNTLEQEMIALNSLKFLNQQLEEARKRLSEAEAKLYEYKQRNKIFETQIDKTHIASQKASLEVKIRDLDTQISVLSTKIDGLKSLLRKKDFSRYTPVQTEDKVLVNLNQQLVSAEIEYELLTRKYKEEHPLVKQAKDKIKVLREKFEEELRKDITALEMQKRLLLAQRKKLADDLNKINQKAMEITSKDAEYVVLEREADSARELFNNLLSAVKEASIQANGSFKDMIYVYEYAEPSRRPIKPNKTVNLVIAVLLGLFLGLCWAVMVEMMDRSVRVPEDVEFHCRIPILTLLPRLEEGYTKNKYPLAVIDRPRSLYSEGIMHLRANLRFILAHQGVRSVVLTSCSPKEGKSIVSANLAVSIAQEGIRTLLIDADLRRPVQHKFFNIERDKGITKALIELLQDQSWKENTKGYTFGDINLLMKLQRQSGLVILNFNSSYPLRLLYQNGKIIAGNIKEWKGQIKANLEDLSPEEIGLEYDENVGKYQILPSLKEEEVEEFFHLYPALVAPNTISYRLFNEYTHSVKVDGLRVMPSGPIPSNPAEILGSVYFREMVNLLKPHFDLIIFDSAPCWPLSDVSMLSQVAESIIFLVRAKRITWDVLNRNNQMLRMLNFKVLGAVFNDFDITRERYYYGSYYYHYYYYYYYYYYGYGYRTEEEEEKSV